MDPKYPVVTEERKHDFEELKAFLEKEIAEDKYLASEATCTEKATCEVCGKKYGEPLNHVLGEWTTGEN